MKTPNSNRSNSKEGSRSKAAKLLGCAPTALGYQLRGSVMECGGKPQARHRFRTGDVSGGCNFSESDVVEAKACAWPLCHRAPKRFATADAGAVLDELCILL
jgi:hypothetical protein